MSRVPQGRIAHGLLGALLARLALDPPDVSALSTAAAAPPHAALCAAAFAATEAPLTAASLSTTARSSGGGSLKAGSCARGRSPHRPGAISA